MNIADKSIDMHVMVEGYLPFHEGLKRVLEFLQSKAHHAKSLGLGDYVLLEEILYVENMIRFAEEELEKDKHILFFHSISSQSLRYLKTGGLVQVHALQMEKKKSGSRDIDKAIDQKIAMIQEDLDSKIYVEIEPTDFYYDIVANDESDQIKEQKYNILDEEFMCVGSHKVADKFRCFVILPIGKEDSVERENNMAVYKKIIEPCVKVSGYDIDCYHADLIEKSGDISRQVIEALRDDDIVIVDLRRGNPNVIYELGIRHTFGKRSILICSEQAEHFFHTTKYRAIRYRLDGKSNKEFSEKIGKQIGDIVQSPAKFDNPVTDILGYRTIDFIQQEKTKRMDRLYLSRIFRRPYSLGELYNPSGEDILDLIIVLDYVNKDGHQVTTKAKVIHNFDNPVLAVPFYPAVIKQKEVLYITDFPKPSVKVTVTGKLALTRADYQQTFNIPKHEDL